MGALRDIVRGESNIDIIGRKKLWLIVSGTVLGLSLIGLFGRQFTLSIDFEGGTSFAVPLKKAVTVKQVQSALEAFSLPDIRPQITTDRTTGSQQLLVRTPHIPDRAKLARVQDKLAELGGQTDTDLVSFTDVGPTWGKQIRDKAVRGLIVFLILVTIYISIRFEPKMAMGALAALFHDLLATAGIYALLGITVTPATIIALLTLLGYSLYDTVVVFDKISENAAQLGGSNRTTYSEMVNRSVNQVMMRSINTSLSTLLPISALLLVGVVIFRATTLEDLAVALFIGTVVGTYSSIFVASPILAALKEREPRYAAIRARAGDVRAPRVQDAIPEPVGAPNGDEPVTRAPSHLRPMERPAPRPRKRKRGKRR